MPHHVTNYLPSLIAMVTGLLIILIWKSAEVIRARKILLSLLIEQRPAVLTVDECARQWREFHQKRYDTFQRRYRLALGSGVAQGNAYDWAHNVSQYGIPDRDSLRALRAS